MFKVKDVKSNIIELKTIDSETIIPDKLWNEYDECYCEIKKIDYCGAYVGRLLTRVALPMVALVSRATGSYPVGHGMYLGESNPDYKHVYLLAGNGKLTRKIDKAKIYWIDFPKGASLPINMFMLDKPKNYMIIELCLMWKAQDRLDSVFPLPRKAISKKERELTYQKFNGHCAYCGKPITLKEMQVDHIKSHMTNCGKDELDNYYPACPVCNRVKSDYTLEQFKNQIKRCGEIHRSRKKPINADSDKIAVSYGIDKEDKPITFYFEKAKE